MDPAKGSLQPAKLLKRPSVMSRDFSSPLFGWIYRLRGRVFAIEIGQQFQLTAYDAVYLELARREGLPLATLDKGCPQRRRTPGWRC